jgi:hypothetical protein
MAAALQGDLSAFRLADVLTFLSGARKSGALAVSSSGRETEVFFRDGSLVYAFSNQEQLRLGSILLRRRMITREQRDAIDGLMRRDGGRFGTLAIQEGHLSEEQVRDFLKVQVSEIVFDAFVWDHGTFVFGEESSLPPHAVTISIDLPNLIMEGARRIAEWEQCVKLLPDSSLVFRVVAMPREEKITLTADEWRILFLINGQRTIHDLCGEGEEDPAHVYRLLYGLYANKLIEPVQRAGEDSEAFLHQADETMRQSSPSFGRESTVRDEEQVDDTSLLLASDLRLSYDEMVRTVLAQLRFAHDGSVIPLTEAEYLVGRHRENAIQLNDPGVSGFHARIYRGPDGYTIEDMKSRNGTWVNDERVQLRTLTSGDRIHVGQTDLVFEVLL